VSHHLRWVTSNICSLVKFPLKDFRIWKRHWSNPLHSSLLPPPQIPLSPVIWVNQCQHCWTTEELWASRPSPESSPAYHLQTHLSSFWGASQNNSLATALSANVPTVAVGIAELKQSISSIQPLHNRSPCIPHHPTSCTASPSSSTTCPCASTSSWAETCGTVQKRLTYLLTYLIWAVQTSKLKKRTLLPIISGTVRLSGI